MGIKRSIGQAQLDRMGGWTSKLLGGWGKKEIRILILGLVCKDLEFLRGCGSCADRGECLG